MSTKKTQENKRGVRKRKNNGEKKSGEKNENRKITFVKIEKKSKQA